MNFSTLCLSEEFLDFFYKSWIFGRCFIHGRFFISPQIIPPTEPTNILLWISSRKPFRSFQEAPGDRGMAAIAEHSTTGAEAQLTKAGAQLDGKGGVRRLQLSQGPLRKKTQKVVFLG